MDAFDFLNLTEIHIKKYKNTDTTLYDIRWYTFNKLFYRFIVF